MQKVEFLNLERMHQVLRDDLHMALDDVLDNDSLILGNSLGRFECQFATFCGADDFVGCASGLDALISSLRCCGVGVGDEVIVPEHTFYATWLAVSAVGATIIPCPIDIETYCIDLGGAQSLFTSKTKAVIPVHMYGYPVELGLFREICAGQGIYVIEDAAQAHGAKVNGVSVGSASTAAAWSFYPGKNLGALGDGGGISFNDTKMAEYARYFRNYGSEEKYRFKDLGVNSRLDSLQAAFLSVKLRYLKKWQENRSSIAKLYAAELGAFGQLTLPVIDESRVHAWHLYVVRLGGRDDFAQDLFDFGIGTGIHYPVPIHMQEAYKACDFSRFDMRNAELVACECLSLPIDPFMTEGELDFVISGMKKLLNSKEY
jgi:dTDP-4-amino-4,6-dideoxygalactose transaminase